MTFTLETSISLFSDPASTTAETPSPLPGVTLAVTLPVANPPIPAQYGTVIYQRNGSSPKHVYVIADSHRSALTGRNGVNTVRTQIEIYRIGEWLIRHENVQLVLPEGFFKRKSISVGVAPTWTTPVDGAGVVDDKFLEDRFNDDGAFISAEMLLKTQHRVLLRQVEDEYLHAAVGEFLRFSESIRKRSYIPIFFNLELEQMQGKRTAAMLQNIPKAIDYEFCNGYINNRKAIFTIGMNHIDDILRYLDANSLSTSPVTATECQAKPPALQLMDEDYGVTVILPKTLAEDQEARRLTKLKIG